MSHAHAHTDSGARVGHAAGSSDADHAAPEGMDDLLELDAEVLHDYWNAALDWVRDAAAGTPPGATTAGDAAVSCPGGQPGPE